MEPTGIDRARALIPTFAFGHFRIVREFRFCDRGGLGQSIDMTLESEDYQDTYELVLHFDNVTQVRINGFGGGETRIVGFDVVSISDRQWENVNFNVIDFENQVIDFFSQGAEIKSLRRLERSE